jgi:hypothetical protein
VAHAGEGAEVRLDAHLAETDIEHHRVHTGGTVALQLRQERCIEWTPNRHAAMVVPNQASAQQRAGAYGLGGRSGSRIHERTTPVLKRRVI